MFYLDFMNNMNMTSKNENSWTVIRLARSDGVSDDKIFGFNDRENIWQFDIFIKVVSSIYIKWYSVYAQP